MLFFNSYWIFTTFSLCSSYPVIPPTLSFKGNIDILAYIPEEGLLISCWKLTLYVELNGLKLLEGAWLILPIDFCLPVNVWPNDEFSIGANDPYPWLSPIDDPPLFNSRYLLLLFLWMFIFCILVAFDNSSVLENLPSSVSLSESYQIYGGMFYLWSNVA